MEERRAHTAGEKVRFLRWLRFLIVTYKYPYSAFWNIIEAWSRNMVTMVQLEARQFVVLEVAGSRPACHPMTSGWQAF